MSYQIEVHSRCLHFKKPAGTSRGIYTERKSWFIHLSSSEHPERIGIGECAPLPNLSCDDVPNYEEVLANACQQFTQTGIIDIEGLRNYPSILFGLETALRHYQVNHTALWDTPFSRGEAGIPINGLIWMGSYRDMIEQVAAKIEAGFRCIKLKIGAIDFEEELNILRIIRQQFSAREIELRVDANGAFSPTDAMEKLKRLAELDLHSIEQPIRAGQWEEMACLTASTPLPIALDEELIGINQPEKKAELLRTIRPQYIILKPSLHGGIQGGEEWIKEAEKQHIGWWITSALESNIGLNAIAQWCATFDNPLPQGLGTGALFTDNIEMPLEIRRDCLWYNGK
ncbi:MAG: o-succinylbenzoate synthase [Parabacteroides sp.]|nr:o-succinylbenzoate synthase [Parabacteroides sp.]